MPLMPKPFAIQLMSGSMDRMAIRSRKKKKLNMYPLMTKGDHEGILVLAQVVSTSSKMKKNRQMLFTTWKPGSTLLGADSRRMSSANSTKKVKIIIKSSNESDIFRLAKSRNQMANRLKLSTVIMAHQPAIRVAKVFSRASFLSTSLRLVSVSSSPIVSVREADFSSMLSDPETGNTLLLFMFRLTLEDNQRVQSEWVTDGWFT
mmetsp:Transcript_9047/g.15300  ORF Transcript_9047/g.15300 Transcript_9047/m.15300 type:complete len:204 (+) Transcript_9047:2264-2875(+)